MFVTGLALQDRQREKCLDSPGMITASKGVTETVPLMRTYQASDPPAHYLLLCLQPQGRAGVQWPLQVLPLSLYNFGAASKSLGPDEHSREPPSVTDTPTRV